MPFERPRGAVRNASLIAAAVVSVAKLDGEVDDADGRGRNAKAEAVDLALKLGDDERRGPWRRRWFVGIMLRPAERARRGSLWATSRMR